MMVVLKLSLANSTLYISTVLANSKLYIKTPVADTIIFIPESSIVFCQVTFLSLDI